jgi:hypothetical protein
MVSYAPLHILLVIFVLSTLIRISLAQNTSSNGSTFTPGTPLSQPPFTPPTSDAKTWADSFLAYTPHIIAAACLLAIAYFKWRLLANHVGMIVLLQLLTFSTQQQLTVSPVQSGSVPVLTAEDTVADVK